MNKNLTTVLNLSGEMGIVASFVEHLSTLVATVPAVACGEVRGADAPTLQASLTDPDDGYCVAVHVSTLLGSADERNVHFQITMESFDTDKCAIQLSVQYDLEEEVCVNLELDVMHPEQHNEIGLQLALFVSNYFSTGNTGMLQSFKPELETKVLDLGRTIPL